MYLSVQDTLLCREVGERVLEIHEREISNKPKSSRKRGHQEGNQSDRIAALEAEI
jgi:hypothetical protein